MSNESRRWVKAGLGIAVSTACVAYILLRIDYGSLAESLVSFHWPLLAFALLALCIDYFLRILRWSKMLRAGGAIVSARLCAPPFLGSMALNNVLPLRAGDVVRALVFPSFLGIRRSTATASLVVERLLDVVSILICLGIGLVLSPSLQLPGWLERTVAISAIAATLLLVGTMLFARPLAERMRMWAAKKKAQAPKLAVVLNHIQLLLTSMSAMSEPRMIASLLAISLLVWFANTGLYFAVLGGFSIAANPSTALAIMAIATLSTLVPSSPGYVGPFHLATYASIVMIGGDSTQAAGFALVSHLALWLPVTIGGMVAIALTPRLFLRSAIRTLTQNE